MTVVYVDLLWLLNFIANHMLLLGAGRLAGAGLYCVESENAPVTRELLTAPNVLVTPHIGGSTADLADAMIPAVADVIERIAAGREIKNVVNQEFLLPYGQG